MHFCIDIDNTVALTDEVMRRVIWDFTRGRVHLEYEDICQFDYYKCPDRSGNQITKDEWDRVHELFSEAHYLRQIKPMPGAVDGLRKIAQMGGTVHLATSRMRKARAATAEWLDRYDFPTHDLHFMKHGEKHASLRPFAAAVEDHYEQATSFAKASPPTPCFLIRHPWNRALAVLERVEWVDGWEELTERLLALVQGA